MPPSKRALNPLTNGRNSSDLKDLKCRHGTIAETRFEAMKLRIDTITCGLLDDLDIEYMADWNLSYLMGGQGDSIQSVDIIEEPRKDEEQ